MSASPDRLFTPRFFLMCGFSFTVFLSAFQLLPTAPFRILELGGTRFAAGLFLGLLTYASAFSAPVTGALGDRIGRRRMLVTCSLVIAGFSAAYAFTTSYRAMLALVAVHGVFWSGLLSSSAAYTVGIIPEKRRAEGIGYWGLSTVAAIAIAPSLGLWVYSRGWIWLCVSSGVLNLVMSAIALRLPPSANVAGSPAGPLFSRDVLEWRVLVVSFTLFLYSFGYGGITSFIALYSDEHGIAPRGIYFTAMAITMLVTRPLSGPLADRLGPHKVLIPCLILVTIGMALLALSPGLTGLLIAAVVFGLGFGSAYPAFAAHVMRHVDAGRRGAAFGGLLAAFDTGIGTGSILMGWIIGCFGFAAAFGLAACIAALALPYFLIVDRRMLPASPAEPR